MILFLRRRRLFCVTLAWMAGVWLGSRVHFSWALLAIPAGVWGIWILRRGQIVLWLGISLLAMVWSAWCMAPPSFPGEGTWRVQGCVKGPVVVGEDDAARFDLSDLRFLVGEEWIPIHGSAYVYAAHESAQVLTHGDALETTARVRLPEGQRNPGGFDLRRWALGRGDSFLFTVNTEITRQAATGFSIVRFSIALSHRMDALFGEIAPLFRAFFLGDRAMLPEAWRDAFAQAGIIHLLAVSGLHIGFLYKLLDELLRRTTLPLFTRFIAIAVLLAVYAIMTGLSPSVLRASWMILFITFARVIGRKPDPVTNLAAAALSILIVRPWDLFAAGFQLSFGAVLGIALFHRPLLRMLRWLPKWLREGFAVSIAAQAGALAPAVAMSGWIPLLGPFVNLVVVPLSGLLFPLTLPVLVLDYVWHNMALWLAYVPMCVMAVILWLGNFVGKINWVARIPGRMALPLVFSVFSALFILSDALRLRTRLRIQLTVVVFGMGLLLGMISMHTIYFTQLDVGQALASVLHTPEATVVYDTGRDGRELYNYLMYTGENIDALFLSHGHADHFGGLIRLLNSPIQIRNIYITSAIGGDEDPLYTEALLVAEARGVLLTPVQRGDKIPLDSHSTTEILWPPAGYVDRDANECSMVVRVETYGHTLLWTGDVGRMEPLRGINCEILQVGHHGSQYSASTAFMSMSAPAVALISCGANNPYLPHPALLDRLAGVTTFRTDQSGAITVQLDAPLLTVTTFVGE